MQDLIHRWYIAAIHTQVLACNEVRSITAQEYNSIGDLLWLAGSTDRAWCESCCDLRPFGRVLWRPHLVEHGVESAGHDDARADRVTRHAGAGK